MGPLPASRVLQEARAAHWCARCSLRIAGFTSPKWYSGPYSPVEAAVQSCTSGTFAEDAVCACCRGILHGTAFGAMVGPPRASGSSGVISQHMDQMAVCFTLAGRPVDAVELAGALRNGKASSFISAMAGMAEKDYYLLRRDYSEEVLQLVAHSGFDMRDGINICIQVSNELLQIEVAAREKLCAALGLTNKDLIMLDIKESTRIMMEACLGRIRYAAHNAGSNYSPSELDVVLTCPQAEKVLQSFHRTAKAVPLDDQRLKEVVRSAQHTVEGANPSDPSCALTAADALTAAFISPQEPTTLPKDILLPSESGMSTTTVSEGRLFVDLGANNAASAPDYNQLSVYAGGMAANEAIARLTYAASAASASTPAASSAAAESATQPSRALKNWTCSSLNLTVHFDLPDAALSATLRARQPAPMNPDINVPVMATAVLSRTSLLIAGKYCKFARGLAQTPW